MTTQSLSQLLITDPEIQTLLESSLWKEVADFINAIPVIANPEPQQDIPVSATLQDVLGLVTPQERFAIGETQAYRRILDAVNQSRFDWVVDNLTTLLGGGGIISQSSYDAILSALDSPQMIPDPNYQAQISGQSLSQQNGLGFVDERQIMLVWLN